MIVKALIDYYEVLKNNGVLPEQGWFETKISYALQLSVEGELVGCMDLTETIGKGEKLRQVSGRMIMPAPVKRTGPTFRPNFLYDNSAYTLGIDTKGDPERAKNCFLEAGRYYRRLLKAVEQPECGALLKYYETWEPQTAGAHPCIQKHIKELLKGVNITFMVNGRFLHEIPELRAVWDTAYSDETELKLGTDMVSNACAPIAVIHPGVRGIVGAQASGSTLISFNEPSACSYGKTQGFNAPISKEHAFAYTSALNRLAEDRDHCCRIDTVSIFHWAKNGDPGYQELICALLFGKDVGYTEAELENLVERIISGETVRAFDACLLPDMPYFFLAITPNVARLAVQVFQQDTMGNFLCSILAWRVALRVENGFEESPRLSLYEMLTAGGTPCNKEASLNPVVTGQVLRTILTGQPMPIILYDSVQRSIVARRDITAAQAAIVKGYYLLSGDADVSAEVLTEQLNPHCDAEPYILGRLFAVLEQIQHRVQPGQRPLRERYLLSAARNPAEVFPQLLRRAETQMRALGPIRRYYRREVQALLACLEHGYPNGFQPPERGAFQLGYYHQRSASFAAARAHMEEKAVYV